MSAGIIEHHLSAEAYRAAAARHIKDDYGLDETCVRLVEDCIEAGRTLGMGPLACVRHIAKRIPWEEIP